jgi:hypothetical protein
MIPKFDSSGMVCEMQVEQAHFVESGAALSPRNDERNGFSIINGLVPASERGKELNTSEECMGICKTTYHYSNVTIAIMSDGDKRRIRIKWLNRSCS